MRVVDERISRLWGRVVNGVATDDDKGEWARLQFQLRDPYGDMQRDLDKLNAKVKRKKGLENE